MKYINGTIQNKNSQCLTVEQVTEIWAGPLTNGSQAVLLFNRNSTTIETMTINWTDLGWSPNQTAMVRDLWLRKDLGIFTTNYTSTTIQSHGIQMIKITPIH